METQSYYYTFDEQDSNRCVADRHIAVNCAGTCAVDYNFAIDSFREDYFLQYITNGELTVKLNGENRIMHTGDMIVYYPHTRYRYENNGGAPICYYWAHFSGSGAFELLTGCWLENAKLYSIGVNNRITSVFERLFSEFITLDCFSGLSSGEYMQRLCIECARLAKEAESGAANPRIYRVLSYIHRNYSRELSMRELAATEYMSEGRLRALFRECCGMSPRRYLTTLRVQNACRLLTQSVLTVGEIARAVGITDQLYFSRAFKAETGVTPSEHWGLQ